MPQAQTLKAAVHAFIIAEGKILLLKRQNTGFCDGSYSVPAGHVDDREISSKAMLRELKEEVNLSLNKKDLKNVVSMHRVIDKNPYFSTFFEIKNIDLSTLKNKEPNKCSELKWFDINNLPENMVDYVSKAINAYNKGIYYLEDPIN